MKVSFLFGSGADTACMSGLPSGTGFIETLLKGNFRNECKGLLGEKNCSKTGLIHSNSINIYLQTIDTYQDVARQYIVKDKVKMCIDYYNGNLDTKEKKDTVREWCRAWYSAITKGTDNASLQKEIPFFLEYAVFFDTLDEKFNALRLSELNNHGKRVIYAYTQIFVLMLQALYGAEQVEDWNYENLFNLLNSGKSFAGTENNYYKITAKAPLDKFVATTNYTNLVEDAVGKDACYLHGKLTWFEDRKKMVVYDCTTENGRREALANRENIFPFILIPSGVKPLICTKQVDEFTRFSQGLATSNILVIVGYRFNKEDNHINAMISHWLRASNQHKLIYFNFTDGKTQRVELSNLPWCEDMHIIHYDDKIPFADFNGNILDVHIKPADSLEKYQNCIDDLVRSENGLTIHL